MRASLHALITICGVSFLLFFFSSCSGYVLGGGKPVQLNKVTNLYIPLFDNSTQIPHANVLATNSVVDAITHDATYRITSEHKADAVLIGNFKQVRNQQSRSLEEDRLRSQRYNLIVLLEWKVVDINDPQNVLFSGSSSGRTDLFNERNIRAARANVLSDATQRAAERLVLQIADGL